MPVSGAYQVEGFLGVMIVLNSMTKNVPTNNNIGKMILEAYGLRFNKYTSLQIGLHTKISHTK